MMNEELSGEKLIANELSKLSLKEREEVYEDLHGVRDPITETPNLIKDSIEQMEIEIQKIDDKFAYEQALAISKDFVTKRETRIKFLRATLFNPQKAAERIVRYFHCRLTLFGPNYFVRDIGLDDLDEKTSAAIASGVLQVLPNRDSRGRTVVSTFAKYFRETEYMGEVGLLVCARLFFYVLLSITDDEETQKKGIIFVSYSLDQVIKSMATRRKILGMVTTTAQSLPIRLSGFHFCHNASLISPLVSFIAYAAGAVVSVRIRTHYGSHTDCQYNLMSYGIPTNSFPVTLGGELILIEHENWLRKRRLKEEFLRKTLIPVRTVDLPSNADVLLGRGRPFNIHPGNRVLREIVENYFEQYNKVQRDEKTKLAEEIVGIVHKYNGHFLKQNVEAGVWVEVSDLEARNKVNHSFRRKRANDLKASSSAKKVDVGEEGQEKRLKAA